MKIVVSQICAASLLVIIPNILTTAYCDTDHTSDKATILMELQAEDTAGNKQDAAGALKYVTSDHKTYDVSGKLESSSKAQDVQSLQQIFAFVSSSAITTTVTSFKFTGKTAILVEQGTGNAVFTKDGKSATIEGTTVSRVLWIKDPNGVWLEKQSRDLSDDHHVVPNVEPPSSVQ